MEEPPALLRRGRGQAAHPLENAGRKGRARARGGGDLPTPERPERLLALDEALDRVEAANPQAASG